MLQNDQQERYEDPLHAGERRSSSVGTMIALVVIVVALIAAFTLLVRAGTDGIDAEPVETTILEGTGG